MKGKNATQKAAALAGSAIALTVPTVDAAVVAANGIPSPVVPTPGLGEFFWDVDGNGSNDFRIHANYFSEGSTTSSGFFDSYSASNYLNGGGVVQTSEANAASVRNLPLGFVVGDTLAASYEWAFPQSGRQMTANGSSVGSRFDGGNFGSSDNYIGFRFFRPNTETIHYGWAQIQLGSQQIIAAAYNNTPNGPVQIGVIPEPSSMALLGLGVAGLGLLRRRRAA